MDSAQVPQMFSIAAAETGLDDSATFSAAEQIARIIEATPTAAAAFTTRTGTQIEAALPGTVANGDGFFQSILNLATSAGYDITLTAGTGVTVVGDPIVDAQDADGNVATGMFFYRRSAANTFIVYRVA